MTSLRWRPVVDEIDGDDGNQRSTELQRGERFIEEKVPGNGNQAWKGGASDSCGDARVYGLIWDEMKCTSQSKTLLQDSKACWHHTWSTDKQTCTHALTHAYTHLWFSYTMTYECIKTRNFNTTLKFNRELRYFMPSLNCKSVIPCGIAWNLLMSLLILIESGSIEGCKDFI